MRSGNGWVIFFGIFSIFLVQRDVIEGSENCPTHRVFSFVLPFKSEPLSSCCSRVSCSTRRRKWREILNWNIIRFLHNTHIMIFTISKIIRYMAHFIARLMGFQMILSWNTVYYRDTRKTNLPWTSENVQWISFKHRIPHEKVTEYQTFCMKIIT